MNVCNTVTLVFMSMSKNSNSLVYHHLPIQYQGSRVEVVKRSGPSQGFLPKNRSYHLTSPCNSPQTRMDAGFPCNSTFVTSPLNVATWAQNRG